MEQSDESYEVIETETIVEVDKKTDVKQETNVELTNAEEGTRQIGDREAMQLTKNELNQYNHPQAGKNLTLVDTSKSKTNLHETSGDTNEQGGRKNQKTTEVTTEIEKRTELPRLPQPGTSFPSKTPPLSPINKGGPSGIPSTTRQGPILPDVQTQTDTKTTNQTTVKETVVKPPMPKFNLDAFKVNDVTFLAQKNIDLDNTQGKRADPVETKEIKKDPHLNRPASVDALAKINKLKSMEHELEQKEKQKELERTKLSSLNQGNNRRGSKVLDDLEKLRRLEREQEDQKLKEMAIQAELDRLRELERLNKLEEEKRLKRQREIEDEERRKRDEQAKRDRQMQEERELHLRIEREREEAERKKQKQNERAMQEERELQLRIQRDRTEQKSQIVSHKKILVNDFQRNLKSASGSVKSYSEKSMTDEQRDDMLKNVLGVVGGILFIIIAAGLLKAFIFVAPAPVPIPVPGAVGAMAGFPAGFYTTMRAIGVGAGVPIPPSPPIILIAPTTASAPIAPIASAPPAPSAHALGVQTNTVGNNGNPATFTDSDHSLNSGVGTLVKQNTQTTHSVEHKNNVNIIQAPGNPNTPNQSHTPTVINNYNQEVHHTHYINIYAHDDNSATVVGHHVQNADLSNQSSSFLNQRSSADTTIAPVVANMHSQDNSVISADHSTQIPSSQAQSNVQETQGHKIAIDAPAKDVHQSSIEHATTIDIKIPKPEGRAEVFHDGAVPNENTIPANEKIDLEPSSTPAGNQGNQTTDLLQLNAHKSADLDVIPQASSDFKADTAHDDNVKGAENLNPAIINTNIEFVTDGLKQDALKKTENSKTEKGEDQILNSENQDAILKQKAGIMVKEVAISADADKDVAKPNIADANLAISPTASDQRDTNAPSNTPIAEVDKQSESTLQLNSPIDQSDQAPSILVKVENKSTQKEVKQPAAVSTQKIEAQPENPVQTPLSVPDPAVKLNKESVVVNNNISIHLDGMKDLLSNALKEKEAAPKEPVSILNQPVTNINIRSHNTPDTQPSPSINAKTSNSLTVEAEPLADKKDQITEKPNTQIIEEGSPKISNSAVINLPSSQAPAKQEDDLKKGILSEAITDRPIEAAINQHPSISDNDDSDFDEIEAEINNNTKSQKPDKDVAVHTEQEKPVAVKTDLNDDKTAASNSDQAPAQPSITLKTDNKPVIQNIQINVGAEPTKIVQNNSDEEFDIEKQEKKMMNERPRNSEPAIDVKMNSDSVPINPSTQSSSPSLDVTEEHPTTSELNIQSLTVSPTIKPNAADSSVAKQSEDQDLKQTSSQQPSLKPAEKASEQGSSAPQVHNIYHFHNFETQHHVIIPHHIIIPHEVILKHHIIYQKDAEPQKPVEPKVAETPLPSSNEVLAQKAQNSAAILHAYLHGFNDFNRYQNLKGMFKQPEEEDSDEDESPALPAPTEEQLGITHMFSKPTLKDIKREHSKHYRTRKIVHRIRSHRTVPKVAKKAMHPNPVKIVAQPAIFKKHTAKIGGATVELLTPEKPCIDVQDSNSLSKSGLI